MNHVKTFWQEFKAFAFKGNMIDLAVAVVIGAAFKSVIDAIVSDIIMPIVNWVATHKGTEIHYQAWKVGIFPIGHLLDQVLSFLIVALAVFITIVKLTQLVMRPPSEPTTKECPYCLSAIPLKATKCAHCTADLPASTAAATLPI